MIRLPRRLFCDSISVGDLVNEPLLKIVLVSACPRSRMSHHPKIPGNSSDSESHQPIQSGALQHHHLLLLCRCYGHSTSAAHNRLTFGWFLRYPERHLLPQSVSKKRNIEIRNNTTIPTIIVTSVTSHTCQMPFIVVCQTIVISDCLEEHWCCPVHKAYSVGALQPTKPQSGQ